MPRQRRCSLVLLAVVSCVLASCAMPWLDHRTSGELERELLERSKAGLALARVLERESTVEIRFFDGQKKTLPLSCCGKQVQPYTIGTGATISRNRIVMVDRSSATAPKGILNPATVLAALAGGQVVMMNSQGDVLERSEARVNSDLVLPSPLGDEVAFLGMPGGQRQSELGIYVVDFHEKSARKLMAVTNGDSPATIFGWEYPTMDWSPDGKSLLYSRDRSVVMVDVETGQAKKIADGGVALWSPSGDWISYVSMKSEVTLMNVATGRSRVIDPGHGTGSAVEWSPDGKYLLIRESDGSHVPYGCLWVYRVSDEAYVPILYYGTAGPRPHWIQIGQG